MVRKYQGRAGGRRPRQAAGKHPAGPGVREWLAALPQAAGRRRAAAFDTRLSTLFPGSAARLIARSLEDHGYEVITRPGGVSGGEHAGAAECGGTRPGAGVGIGTRRVPSAGTPGVIARPRRAPAGARPITPVVP